MDIIPNVDQIVRASNKFWELMYYDYFIDNDMYQISYVEGANRDYYNCAHAIKYTPEVLCEIEKWFEKKKCKCSIYLEPTREPKLKKALLEKGYKENVDELEKWYHIDKEFIIESINQYDLKTPTNCIHSKMITPNDDNLFSAFLEINALCNNIPHKLIKKFAFNARNKKKSKVQVYYFLGFINNCPAATAALGISNNMGFIAEMATMPEHQRKRFGNNYYTFYFQKMH